MNLPLNIRVDWRPILENLKMKGILNKKGRPANVARLMTLNVFDIIKYFNSTLNGYLSFYRRADDFKVAKTRFYWYFKYFLVSTFKAKLKLGSRRKILNFMVKISLAWIVMAKKLVSLNGRTSKS